MSKYNTEITSNTSGYTSSITLEPGIWNIFVSATTWGGGSGILQTSHDNDTFFNLKDIQGNIVSFAENDVKEINGGVILRTNNITNVSGFYLVAKKAI